MTKFTRKYVGIGLFGIFLMEKEEMTQNNMGKIYFREIQISILGNQKWYQDLSQWGSTLNMK